MNKPTRNRINGWLGDLGRVYHNHVPLGLIAEFLAKWDITFEDCLLCGTDGRATLELTMAEHQVNSMLFLSWHRMETTGHYEVVAYLT